MVIPLEVKLAWAVRWNNVNKVREFMKDFDSIKNRERGYLSQVLPFLAVKNKNFEILKLLFENKFIRENAPGCSLIRFAIENGCGIEFIKLIYDRAKRFKKDEKEFFFHVAAGHGRIDVAKFLLERGWDINRVYDKVTPLYWACREGKYRMVKFLIENGADIRSKAYNF